MSPRDTDKPTPFEDMSLDDLLEALWQMGREVNRRQGLGDTVTRYRDAQGGLLRESDRTPEEQLAHTERLLRESEEECSQLRRLLWTPRDGVWIVDQGGTNKRWIAELPQRVDLAPYARHQDAIAGIVGQVIARGVYSPMDVADALCEWMRTHDQANTRSTHTNVCLQEDR